MAGKLTEDQLRDQVLRRDRDDSKLVDFQTAADGVQLLDTSDMTLAEVVDAITDLAEESRP
jgi:cytidylate kinase